MDTFLSSPPAAVRADLAALRASLDESDIPPKTLDRNVLIGTWRIRGFGKVLEKWDSPAGESPRRNPRDVLCLAEVVSRFDVVAMQEIKCDLAGLRRLMQALGPDWAWILTDFTRGTAGNQERMAFVFDLRRVQPSGLAAELVVPLEQKTTLTETTLQRQFARTPYAVSFESQGTTFTLTLHVLWGKKSAERVPEIREIACWLADWAKGSDEFGDNLMTLGDFNIDRVNDPLYQEFIATGLRPPQRLESLPRTIFQDPDEGHFYDQIAWFVDANGKSTLTEPLRYEDLAGNFDFRPALQVSVVERRAELADLRLLPAVGQLLGPQGSGVMRP